MNILELVEHQRFKRAVAISEQIIYASALKYFSKMAKDNLTAVLHGIEDMRLVSSYDWFLCDLSDYFVIV